MNNKEGSDRQKNCDPSCLQLLPQVDGLLRRAGVRLDRARDTECNGSDQCESDEVSVCSDP